MRAGGQAVLLLACLAALLIVVLVVGLALSDLGGAVVDHLVPTP